MWFYIHTSWSVAYQLLKGPNRNINQQQAYLLLNNQHLTRKQHQIQNKLKQTSNLAKEHAHIMNEDEPQNHLLLWGRIDHERKNLPNVILTHSILLLSIYLLGEAELMTELHKLGLVMLLNMRAQELQDVLWEKHQRLQRCDNIGIMGISKA